MMSHRCFLTVFFLIKEEPIWIFSILSVVSHFHIIQQELSPRTSSHHQRGVCVCVWSVNVFLMVAPQLVLYIVRFGKSAAA